MTGSARFRDAGAALVIAVLAGLLILAPPLDRLHGLSIDLLTALRWRVFGHMYEPQASPAVVVALDEETYRTPPFVGTPAITWTPEIGQVLSAIIAGGAKVVGFDIVFPTSIEQSEIPFGDGTLGGRLRGFDRDFLRALALGAHAGKVVLGEAQHRDFPIMPAPGQRIAVGQGDNIRSLNVYNDPDDVVRRIPLSVVIDGTPQPSMAVELAARALGTAPMTISGYRIAPAVHNTIALNFDGGSEAIPTFSLADLRACNEKGDREFFRGHFDGKVVLIATVLDVEDRQVTSKRFATAPENPVGPRCALPAPPPSTVFARDSIPGVYTHATAVNNLIRGDALIELGRLGRVVISIALAVLTAGAVMALPLFGAVLVYIVAAGVWTSGATLAFTHALSLPLIEPLLAGLVSLGAATGFRFLVADKDRRFLRKSFALYLAPAVIEKMVAANKPPALGGETRNVTVFFSDLAGFSSISEALAPPDLVKFMNEYLSAMTDIIQEYGGFVDKYIGDAIVAVFGAPLDDADHAANAVSAALHCRERLHKLNHDPTEWQRFSLRQRIGLNSGDVLVGNIGSRQRFNYTVMGDTVNVASRLEGANKYFGTSIMAAKSTFDRAAASFAWRELDTIRVQGRDEPISIYEPLARHGQETPEQKVLAAAYRHALACWRTRDYAGCIAALAPVAAADPPSAILLQHAKKLLAHPPAHDWKAVNTLEGK
ncbi:MAG TPA: adenylate/guanylate cyclase domain-containing protein [Xanthobacteraceae bacterium]|nr:adenylate/guanylate cyclase domain-containing protein [Xanthobacteraceae bacterium]